MKTERKFAAMLLSEAEKLPEAWAQIVKTAAETIERLCDAIDADPQNKSVHGSDAERRLRRFAEIAYAAEGRAAGFGSAHAAERELSIIRDDFLGALDRGSEIYEAFCTAIDGVSAADVHKPGGSNSESSSEEPSK